MYVLTGKAVHYLIPGVVYTVGRKTNCDIVVIADANYGISRTHGQIACHTNGELVYTDLSQFGSYVDKEKVGNKSTVPLTSGTILRFGYDPTTWKVEKMLVTASGLSGAVASEIQRELSAVGITYSSRWSSLCTTVIMTDISTTEKVISAVANCRWILTPRFVNDFVKCIQQRSKLSESLRSYGPPINDTTLKSVIFTPLHKRKYLFEGLEFIFMTEKESKQSDGIIVSCGGTSRYVDPLHPDRRQVILSATSVVMKTSDKALASYITDLLVERNLKPTKHSDVVMAIFHVDRNRVFRNIRDVGSTQLHVLHTQALTYSDTQTQKYGSLPQSSIKQESDLGKTPVQVSCTDNLDKSAFEASASFPKLSVSMQTLHVLKESASSSKEKSPQASVNRDKIICKSEISEAASANGDSLCVKHTDLTAVPPAVSVKIPSLRFTSKNDADSRVTKESLFSVQKPTSDSLFKTPNIKSDFSAKTPVSNRLETSGQSLFGSEFGTPVSHKNVILSNSVLDGNNNSTVGQKRYLFEDEDGECQDSLSDNPFRRTSSVSHDSLFGTPAKRQRKEPTIKEEPGDLHPANPCTCEIDVPDTLKEDVENNSQNCQPEKRAVPVKRELLQKEESVSKKLRSSPSDIEFKLNEVTAGMKQWLKIPKLESVYDKGNTPISLMYTEMSSALLVEKKKPLLKDRNDLANLTVPNFKMFRKRGQVSRSISISLTVSKFSCNTEKMLLDSQPSQSICSQEQSQITESNVFARRKS